MRLLCSRHFISNKRMYSDEIVVFCSNKTHYSFTGMSFEFLLYRHAVLSDEWRTLHHNTRLLARNNLINLAGTVERLKCVLETRSLAVDHMKEERDRVHEASNKIEDSLDSMQLFLEGVPRCWWIHWLSWLFEWKGLIESAFIILWIYATKEFLILIFVLIAYDRTIKLVRVAEEVKLETLNLLVEVSRIRQTLDFNDRVSTRLCAAAKDLQKSINLALKLY